MKFKFYGYLRACFSEIPQLPVKSCIKEYTCILLKETLFLVTPQPLRAVGVLFSPMVSGWAGGRPGGRVGGRAAGNSLSGLYLRNRKV